MSQSNQVKLGSESWKRVSAILLVAVMTLMVASPMVTASVDTVETPIVILPAETGRPMRNPDITDSEKIDEEDFSTGEDTILSTPPDPIPSDSVIGVNPATLSATVQTGQTTQENLIVDNIGGTTDLTFSATTTQLISSGSTAALPADPIGFSANHDLNTDNWGDGGNDAFDGYARIDVTVGGITQSSLVITTGSHEYTTDGYTYRLVSDWAENHILRYRIEPVSTEVREDITVRLWGNLGSDSNTVSLLSTFNHDGLDIDYMVTNDWSGIDGTSGDPQVTHFMVPSNSDHLSSVTYDISGDKPDIQAVDVSLPVTVYVTASYHPHADIANWVDNDLLQVSNYATPVPSDGVVSAGSQTTVTVNFDATNLNPGIYTGNVYIFHNDPMQPMIAVPFTLTVLADPHDMRVFDMVSPNIGFTTSVVSVDVTILNQGLNTETNVEVQLLVDGTITDSFTIPTIDPGMFSNFALNWMPLTPGTYTLEVIALPAPLEALTWNNDMSKQIDIFTPMATPWSDGFETGWGEWTTEILSNNHGLTNWEIGDLMGTGPVTAYSGTNCAGTNINDRYYPYDADITLVSHYIELGMGSQLLSFNTWYNTWYGCPGADGGFVEIDDGMGWTEISPNGGYPESGSMGGYNTDG